jgi:hypothetical protein
MLNLTFLIMASSSNAESDVFDLDTFSHAETEICDHDTSRPCWKWRFLIAPGLQNI